MASVWEAYDNVLARSVAVKLLHPHLAADRLFLERFRREAIAAAGLAHPNVVATFDAGVTPEGTAFIVMELIRGQTLSAFLAEHGPLPIFVCVEIATQVADALAHAHAKGLIHRDIKPANVLVCDTETDGVPLVKVTDFGIAKAAEGLGLDLTRTGMILGTPKYLSPEQIEGREPDARADLYALGVVLFEMVTGVPPFRGPTEMAVAVQHLNDAPARLRDLRPAASPALDALVASLLAKRPQDRPPSALVVRQTLAAVDTRYRPASAREASSFAASPVGPPGDPAAPVAPVAPGAYRDPTDQIAVPPPLMGWSGSWASSPTEVVAPVRSPAGRLPTPARQPTAGAYLPPGPGRRPPTRRPNWAGRVVAALVVLALIVVVVVVASHGSGGSSGARRTPPSTAATAVIRFQNASVFHLERDADDAANVGQAIDGNVNTAWQTDMYYGPNFAGLRHGLGLALTLSSPQVLHTLSVVSSTVGWSAQVFVADSVPNPPSLPPWGTPLDSKQNINGSTTFDLHGHKGSAVLLWLTDLGPTNQTTVAEVTAS